jgi:hydrogenase-4 component F
MAVLVAAATAHLATVIAWRGRLPPRELGGALQLDALGYLFLLGVSALFLLAAVYSVGYMRGEGEPPIRLYVPCMLWFLGSMTLVTASHHLGLLWVGIETTTLSSAPLIYAYPSPRALEATWKYLILSSVGIALALLGIFFVAISATGSGGQAPPLLVDLLQSRASTLSVPWLKGGFVLLLVGFGTKMGLAPMHTWLPDAHSEAPSPVSALLSGGLLNCAFLGILRGYRICVGAGLAGFAGELLILLGLVSIATAVAFIIGQPDYKRLLAYSSVEHMGILALGVGLGGEALYYSMLHLVNHSLTKALLFFAAGSVFLAYRTKQAGVVRGVRHSLPLTGAFLLAGLLAVTGSPPFGIFLSEIGILKSALAAGHPAIASAYLAFLTLGFLGMSKILLEMVSGEPGSLPAARERASMVAPMLLLLVAILVLGIYIPPALDELLRMTSLLLAG